MAKKVNQSFRDIMLSIKKGIFSPIYILAGDEPYYLDMICNALESSVMDEADKDFNAEIFYGSDSSIDAVADSARQFPMMTERRLVILKEAQSMDRAKAQLEKLTAYFANPTSTTVLVIVYKSDTLPFNAAAVKAINAAGGIIFQSPQLRDYQIKEPIRDYCMSKKISIEDSALELLVESIGCSLGKLFSEIDKLTVAKNGKLQKITLDLVQDNIGVSKEFSDFELSNALAVRNYAKAMKIVEFFGRNPSANPTQRTVATLFNFFQKLVIANLERDKSDNSLIKALDLKNSYALRGIKDAMRCYNLNQSIGIISAIAEFDRKSKGINSATNEFELLRELVFRICIA